MLALGLTVALIAGFYSLVPVGAARFAALDAGPLTGSHAAFTGEEGCADCHVAHFAGPRAWIRSALGPTDLTEKCSDCHVFGGPARSPHNKTIVLASVSGGTQGKAPGAAARETRTEIDCAACHTEHKGENANISQLTGEQCASCHQIDFVVFDKGHPSFSERYPHFRRNSIKFDHATHLNTHFQDARYGETAPKTCTACHQVRERAPRGRPARF